MTFDLRYCDFSHRSRSCSPSLENKVKHHSHIRLYFQPFFASSRINMRLFGPYSRNLVFPAFFLHCFKSTSLPPLLPHSTLFNLLSFHSSLPNGSSMFISCFSTISPPIIPIHIRPFRSFSFFLFVYRDLLPFYRLHPKFYPLFLP